MNSMLSLTIDYECDWGGRVQSTYAIEKMTDSVLSIFNEFGTKGTFFISTETAEATKPYILAIAKEGHEIASHGHEHAIHYDTLTKDELTYQLSTSKKILEDITGAEILGFRTPQFRKNQYTEEVLLENGYKYDSSSVQVSLKNRYNAMQHTTDLLPSFPVSALYGKLPAGIKWANLFGGSLSPQKPQVVYVHLFDLLSISDTLRQYKKGIPLSVLMFYMARNGSTLSTLKSFSMSSQSLKLQICQ